MRKLLVLPLTTLLLVAGCGGSGSDSTAPAPTHDNIAGTYNGIIVGVAQGVTMNSTFTLTLAQSGGATSGTYGLSGTLNDGTTMVQIAGAGTASGTVASGNNPSVNITIKTPICPNYQAAFSGAYDSTNHRITITGPVDMFNDDCSVAVSYPTTIILNR